MLQVIEFMSNHGAPCFYHHCANITIEAGGGGNDASSPVDGGQAPSGDSGCGCTLGGKPTSAASLLLMLAVLARRRRVSPRPGTRTGS
jgi:MYXO-CTERM domain-containing protein